MKKYLLVAIFTAGSSVILYSSINSRSTETSGPGKVEICHCPPGNLDNCITISVSANAVNAHLAHGDRIGACVAPTTGGMGVFPQ